jgi:hypothetical protein
LTPQLHGYNPEAALNSFESRGKTIPPLSPIRKAHYRITLSCYSAKPIITMVILPLRVCILRSATLLDLNMALLALKDTAIVLASFSMTLIPCGRS